MPRYAAHYQLVLLSLHFFFLWFSLLHTPDLNLHLFLLSSAQKFRVPQLLFLHSADELLSLFRLFYFWVCPLRNRDVEEIARCFRLVKFLPEVLNVFLDQLLSNVCDNLCFLLVDRKVVLCIGKGITSRFPISYRPSQMPASTDSWIPSNRLCSSCLSPNLKSRIWIPTKSKELWAIAS